MMNVWHMKLVHYLSATRYRKKIEIESYPYGIGGFQTNVFQSRSKSFKALTEMTTSDDSFIEVPVHCRTKYVQGTISHKVVYAQ